MAITPFKVIQGHRFSYQPKAHMQLPISNTDIALCWPKLPHRYWSSHAIWDHTVLPATRQRWHSTFTPAKAGTRFSDPGGMQGWVDLVINTNLPPILHHFQDIAFDMFKIAIFGYLCCVQLPRQRGSPGTISAKFFMDVNRWPTYQMP